MPAGQTYGGGKGRKNSSRSGKANKPGGRMVGANPSQSRTKPLKKMTGPISSKETMARNGAI